MAQKLYRRRTKVFHKKNKAPLKAVTWVLAAALLVTGGYFGAKFLMERESLPTDLPADLSSAPDVSGTVSSPSSAPAPSTPSAEPTAGGVLRAVYLPLATLRDAEARDAALNGAAAAGLNAVVFDLKDSNGQVYFSSSAELAVQAQTAADAALTAEELRALFQALKDKGFAPVPRLYAFRDHLAPGRLSSAKISVAGNPGWTWYDGDPNNGGKPWLNPYADAARQYLIGLMDELKKAGAGAILLDGVEFPKQLSQANLTAEQQTAAAKAEALSAFVAEAQEAMAQDTAVLLAAPGLAALGTDTGLYGGNPITFGPDGAAPVLLPSTLGKTLSFGESRVDGPAEHPYEAVKLALTQIQTRLQVVDKDKRPFLMPWLQGYGYGADDVKAQIRAVSETVGEDASYILYNPDGVYDFAALSR